VLETIRAAEQTEPARPRETRRLNFSLGLAYDRLGRADEARAQLSRALEAYSADPKSQEMFDLRGNWAWFLLTRGETDAAAAAFDAILRDQPEMQAVSVSPALAWAGRARLALQRGDDAAATAAITHGFEAYDKVAALHDVRVRTTLLLTRSAVALAKGDKDGARRDATAALADAERMDAPDSAAIREARQALAETAPSR
jgi:tetratricopeptide (TPR) repeat protein